ncbi:MAG: trypsin-like peptidase domain-containing protein [bacterium]
MQLRRLLTFLFTSITTGLAAAFIVVLLRPDLLTRDADISNARIAPAVSPSSYSGAVKRASPAVVSIYATKLTRERANPLADDPLMKYFFGDKLGKTRIRRENALGSGVVIDGNGIILTNNHVIDGASEIHIQTGDGTVSAARVVGTDPDTDLAVLQTGGKALPVADLGDSEAVEVGDVVLAIGNPFGVGKTVTQGIVSAIGRHQLGLAYYEDFIQTDAAINQGNSGGALINAHGEVIGINAAILSRSGGSHGIGFAIPIAIARQVTDHILQHGRVIRGWIGLSGQNLTAALSESFGINTDQGILVAGVLENGPADLAGILPGDVIIELNGQAISETRDILNRVAQATPGTNLTLTILSDNQRREIDVPVSERPADAKQ